MVATHLGRFAGGIVVSALLATASAQNLVVNGGFESPVISGSFANRPPGSTFGDWTVDNFGNGIAHVGSFGNPDAIEGLQFVELNWLVSGGVSQTIPTTPSVSYVISFLLAGQLNAGPDVKEVRVDWDGTPLATVPWSRSGTGGHWVRHALIATATSSSTALHFFGATPANDDGGPYIDDVRVRECIDIFGQPVNARDCGSGAAYSIGAAGIGTLSYQWQIQTSPNVWVTIGNDPLPLACGGFVVAQPFDAEATTISIHNCIGGWAIRAIVSNACGSLTSNEATLTRVNIGADMNCDCNVNNFDIDAFVLALANPNSYHATYPACNILNADVNHDGTVNNFDIDPFVICLTNGCP